MQFLWAWRRQVKAKLESSPYRSIEEFGVIGRGHDHDVCGKLVHLKEQRADNPLYLPCFVDIAPLLAYCVELIEKKNTGSLSRKVKDLP